jgi:hypothetical protein
VCGFTLKIGNFGNANDIEKYQSDLMTFNEKYDEVGEGLY